jgi:hypothetical protein
MKKGSENVLLASAASRQQTNRRKLTVLVAAGFVAVIAIIITIGNVGSVTEANLTEPRTTPEKKTSTLTKTTSSQVSNDVEKLNKFYISKVRDRLLSIPAHTIIGKKSLDVIAELDLLFNNATKNPQSHLIDQINNQVKIAKDLASDYDQLISEAIDRLNSAFASLDSKGFNRELANLLIITEDNDQVLSWQQQRHRVMEYFGYMSAANQARAEKRQSSELAALQQIVNLGFGSTEIQQRINELKASIARQNYASYVKKTLNYIKREDFRAAESELKKASRLFPNNTQTIELGVTVANGLRKTRIDELLRSTEILIKQDQWQQASKNYSSILMLNPNNQSAIEGKSKASVILRLQTELRDIYHRPLRLKDLNILNYAQGLLVDSKSLLKSSPALKGLYTDVLDLVETKMVARSILIESDGKAKIRVQGIGYISPTKSKTIKLTPGVYRFYAECRGYRTKLYNVTIPVEGQVVAKGIICGDKI